MRKGLLAFALVGVAMAVSVSLSAAAVPAEGPGPAAGAEVGATAEHPPQWNRWTEQERNRWRHGMDAARESVRAHARRREQAAVRACEAAACAGAPFDDAVSAAKIGLDEGLDVEDFNPLGQAVAQWAHQGLNGQALAETVRSQVRARKQHREQQRLRRQAGAEGMGQRGGQGQGMGQGGGQGQGMGQGGGQGRGRGGGGRRGQ
jgi:hypothetical protein